MCVLANQSWFCIPNFKGVSYILGLYIYIYKLYIQNTIFWKLTIEVDCPITQHIYIAYNKSMQSKK